MKLEVNKLLLKIRTTFLCSHFEISKFVPVFGSHFEKNKKKIKEKKMEKTEKICLKKLLKKQEKNLKEKRWK